MHKDKIRLAKSDDFAAKITDDLNDPIMFGREVLQNAIEGTLSYRDRHKIQDGDTSDIFVSNRMPAKILTYVCSEFAEKFEGIEDTHKVFFANPGSFGDAWDNVWEQLTLGIDNNEKSRGDTNHGIGVKTVLHEQPDLTYISKYPGDDDLYSFTLHRNDIEGGLEVFYHDKVDNAEEIKKLLPKSIAECDEFTCVIGHGKNPESYASNTNNIHTWNRGNTTYKDDASMLHLYFKDRFYEIPDNINIYADRVSKSDSKEPYQLFETWPQLYENLEDTVGFKQELVEFENGMKIRYILNSKERRKDAGDSNSSPTGKNCSGFGTLTSKFIWKGPKARFYEGYNHISPTNNRRIFQDLGIVGYASSFSIEVILNDDGKESGEEHARITLNRTTLYRKGYQLKAFSMGDMMKNIVDAAPKWFKEEIEWHNERSYKKHAASGNRQDNFKNAIEQYQSFGNTRESLSSVKLFDSHSKDGNVGHGNVKDKLRQPLLDFDNENKSTKSKKVPTKKGINYDEFQLQIVDTNDELADSFKNKRGEHTTIGGMLNHRSPTIIMIENSPVIESAFRRFMNNPEVIKLCQCDANYKNYLKEQFIMKCEYNLVINTLQAYTDYSQFIGNNWDDYYLPQNITSCSFAQMINQSIEIIKAAKKEYDKTGGTKFNDE
jgi:hypothetical protein